MQVQKTGGSTFPVGSLRRANHELQKILEKLSTAQRINRASDDAAGLAVSEQLRSNIRGFKVATQNISDAMSALNITDGVANQSTAILQRQRELAIQSRNDTLSDKNRAALDSEYQQLTKELDRIADGTKFNKQDLTSGQGLASGNAVIQSGPESDNQMTLPEIDIRSASLGVQPTSIATSAGANQAIEALDNALGSINSQRSTVGATVNRLYSSVNNLNVAMVNTQAAESVLRDEDMAKGLMELTQARLLQESSTTAFARFNEINKSYVRSLIG
ncbi:MAG: flagellin [Fibrobacter sp.]|nr:flagellin [Fibrobacter sp.]